jgi:hypothetical protein
LNPAAPHGANGEGISDIGQWVTVDQQQISECSWDNPPAVGESETTRGGGGRSAQRLDRRKSCRDQQLQFVVQAGAVSESAKDR